MTQSFNRPGAVDLTALKTAPVGASGQYVQEVTEANFESVIAKSMKHPVVLELTSPRAEGAADLSNDLADLAAEAAGKFLLARVDVDAVPAIAGALQVQAVPMVVAVIGGQLAPLFQGVQPKAAIGPVLDQVYQAAVANGIVGRAEPVLAEATETDEPQLDPRLEPAYTAMEEGDFETAIAEFDKVLTEIPNHEDAKAGRAQAALIVRTSTIDPAALKTMDPGAISTAMVLADIEMVGGRPEAAFERLLSALANVFGDERETLRKRILELFELLGSTDPAVSKARRRLTTLLF